MFKHKISVLEEMVADMADCDYTTKSQVMGHIYSEIERQKTWEAEYKASQKGGSDE